MVPVLFVLLSVGFDLAAFNARKNEALRTGAISDFVAYAHSQRDSYPREVEINFGLAEALLRVDDFTMATRMLKDAIRDRPVEPTLHRGRALLENYGRLGEQIELYGEYRNISKNRIAAAYEVAGLYRRLNDHVAAAGELLNWLRFDSLAGRGPALEAIGQRISECHRSDRKVRTLVARTPLAREVKARLMARLYLADRAYEAALREYLSLGDRGVLLEFARICEAERLDSVAAACYERLGMNIEAARIHIGQQRFDRARRCLKNDQSTPALLLRAQALAGSGDGAAAANLLDSVPVQCWPASAFILGARLKIAQGDSAAAEARLNRAVQVVAGESLPGVLWARGELTFARCRWAEAVAGYNELAANFPGNPLANDALERLFLIRRAGTDTSILRAFGRIVMLRLAGANVAAVDSACSFIKRWPGLAEYGYEFIVETHAENGEAELALAAIDQYARACPTGARRARMLLVKAELCLKTGSRAQARSALETLLDDFSSSPEAGTARELLKRLPEDG